MSGKETMSKAELEALKAEWLAEMKANMKVWATVELQKNKWFNKHATQSATLEGRP